ncbi:MAG: hypothetical protein COY66_00925 [Candidatus Kerfeldbacteria bacterium CG_4_10_14_0_8_um_filter_42_10]|uniref:DUF2157 domain-containing protein n=1 Tax=Candidatus Kerfeldbacteria bacterium CG_4_10_14_0_8_um_filter_42_10 TaxID=2014248 RepID=A0A2M7RK69_9BACT|nr:MAG: hypothetical protein COY66_00925 [Candidatus Kerfeldbacteria bacterium CG_4_10_14_0_8_um_filter_42_10]
MYLIAAFWLVFAASWLFRDSDYRYFYATNGLGYAVVLAMLGYYLNKKQRWAWWGAVILTGLSILLTIFDQIGWFDLAYLVPAVALFYMLLVVRKEVLGGKVRG